MSGKDIFCHHHYLLVLLLFGVCDVLFLRAEEAIIKSGTCKEFFEYSVKEKNAPTWNLENVDSSCHTCNGLNNDKSWFHTKFLEYNDTKLVHAHLILQATACPPCKGQYVKIYVIFEDLTILNGGTNTFNDKIIKKFNSLRLVKKIEMKSINKKESHTITFVTHPNSRGVSLVFLSEGGCIVIFSLKITYFYCKETFDKAVALLRTGSPTTGSLRVNSSCSSDTVPNGGEAFGLCYSNGTWSVRSPCSCKKGFTLESNGCKSCQEGTYKDHIGNGRCFPCPSHSRSSNGIKCECEQGYYRFVGENYTHACHGIPSAVEGINIQKSDKSVDLKWFRPSRTGVDKVFYDIECFECKGDECKDPCQKETYSPSKSNLTRLNVKVENLEPNTTYEFVIYSKNANSYRISRKEWASARKTIKTSETGQVPPVKSTVPTLSRPGFDISPIVSAIVTFFVLLIIGTSCLFGLWMRKRRKNRPANNTSSQLELDDLRPSERERTPDYEITDSFNATNEPPEYEEIDVATIPPLDNYYEFWEIPKDHIVMLKTLGHGSFGTVKKAWIKSIHGDTSASGKVVAVKLLKENATLRDEEDFLNELDVMKKLVRHRFVVQLLGCCTQSEPYHLILEYLPGGDLLGYLRKSRGYKDSYNTGELVPTSRLNETELMRFAWMVSDAMVSLSSQGVVHRDLAARNVLVGEGNICKVSDFGLAREGRYERKTKARLPVKWMAPEDLLHGLCTSRSDVWAYGILLWEIFTVGDSPYPAIKGPDVIGLIEAGYRMPKPAHCSDSLYAIMLKCWNDNPDERPAFTEIRSFFKEHLQNNQVCLDLSKYDDDEYLNFDVVD